jgi:hypothetical protein
MRKQTEEKKNESWNGNIVPKFNVEIVKEGSGPNCPSGA